LTEQNGGYIDRFTATGSLTQFPLGKNHSPYLITTGSKGNIWWIEAMEGPGGDDWTVGTLTPSGVKHAYPLPNMPFGIAADRFGNFWIPTPDSNQLAIVTPAGDVTVSSEQGSLAAYIARGPGNQMFYSNPSGIDTGTVGSYSPTGQLKVLAKGLPAPEQIIEGPDGNLWFSEAQSSEITRMSPSGSILQIPIPRQCFYGSAVGPDGNIWCGASGYLVGVNPFTRSVTSIPVLNGLNVTSLAANPVSQTLDFVGYNMDGLGRQSLLQSTISQEPSAPTDVSVKSGRRSLAVDWARPTWRGSGPILRYMVVAMPGSTLCKVSAKVTTCTVRGLRRGSAYTISVVAVNSKGSGAPSLPIVASTRS
jgi:streptogramin lyase